MESRKGFTLIELMVVILIVGILAAVAIPIMRGRIDSAKWSEGKAMMGTIATAIRAYVSETNRKGTSGGVDDWASELGFHTSDLDGTYFDPSMFTIVDWGYDPNDAVALTFTIQASNTALYPNVITLDQTGTWGP